MHAFDVLGDPVRRRILELLAASELASGEVVDVISAEFGISQAAVSQHLKVLRESGFASVRAEGTRRIYAIDAAPLQQVDAWLDHFRGFWTHKLLALHTSTVCLARALVQSGALDRKLFQEELVQGRAWLAQFDQCGHNVQSFDALLEMLWDV